MTPVKSRRTDSNVIRGLLVAVSLVLFMSASLLHAANRPPKKKGFDLDHVVASVSTEEMMIQIRKKCKKSNKKYAALGKKIAKYVEKSLNQTVWESGLDGGSEKPLIEHPYIELVGNLQKTVSNPSKNTPEDEEMNRLLAKYPWNTRLELVLGLQDGTDRPIPKHKNGFIDLGKMTGPLPGYPELQINRYLYGYREIVSWQYRVKDRKSLEFKGRTKTDGKPTYETESPPWESIRLYLEGMLPEVPFYAIPQLTHQLHSALVEQRRDESGELSRVDEVLAFIDSKWNGFHFLNPFTGKAEPFIVPVHSLFMEKGGFVYLFPVSSHLASQGDLPFVSLRTYQEYGNKFLNENVSIREFIRDTAGAYSVRGQFQGASSYLRRYKGLIDLIVRAILAPDLEYPKYLSSFDYQKDFRPSRKIGTAVQELDMPRKHALIVWAYVGQDIEKLAALLHDEILNKPENRFPKDVALPVQFTHYVRKNEQAMMESIIRRIKEERSGEASVESGWCARGGFESLFSPYSNYRSLSGSYHSDFLAASYHASNAQVSATIKRAAYECVLKEIGDKWLR